MNKDIHVWYSGGSGGHICSHLILESQRHFCCWQEFDTPHTAMHFADQFQQVKHQQWCIQDSSQWKTQEFWPRNQLTAQHSVESLNRLFLTCNPSADLSMDQKCVNVLIYTDLETQWHMSIFKHCFVFFGVDKIKDHCRDQCNQSWQQSYSSVKDSTWPMVNFDQIDQLPVGIIDELGQQHHGFEPYLKWLEHRDIVQTYQELCMSNAQAQWIDNQWLSATVLELMPRMNHAIRLQDIVGTQGRCLLDALELPWHQGHADLIQRWLNLHPRDLQTRLLNKTNLVTSVVDQETH